MFTVIVSNVHDNRTKGSGVVQFAVRNNAEAFAITASLTYQTGTIVVMKVTELYSSDGTLLGRYNNGELV